MNRFWTFFLIAFGFMLTGCSTGRIASLNRKPNEAIIIAKIQIKNRNNFVQHTLYEVIRFGDFIS